LQVWICRLGVGTSYICTPISEWDYCDWEKSWGQNSCLELHP